MAPDPPLSPSIAPRADEVDQLDHTADLQLLQQPAAMRAMRMSNARALRFAAVEIGLRRGIGLGPQAD